MKHLILTLILSFVSSSVLAHGEDKLGPNKGYIKMPSNYHTEVVPDGKNRIKVYLLDINWKNPSVKKSKLEAVHKTAATSSKAMCLVGSDHYICSFSKAIDLTQPGELTINSQREGQKGAAAVYALPFKLQKSNTESTGHGGHH
ncbi:hypothetical protein K2P97_08475 [bacterium]|nr:hypothetical protein [bacterium]